MTQQEIIYRISYIHEDSVYELYARSVAQSNLFGFIEIEEFVFGEQSGVLVDPNEERLKNEFAGVIRSYIPMNAVIRIDEVEERGTAKIHAAKGDKVTPFPLPVKPNKNDAT